MYLLHVLSALLRSLFCVDTPVKYRLQLIFVAVMNILMGIHVSIIRQGHNTLNNNSKKKS